MTGPHDPPPDAVVAYGAALLAREAPDVVAACDAAIADPRRSCGHSVYEIACWCAEDDDA